MRLPKQKDVFGFGMKILIFLSVALLPLTFLSHTSDAINTPKVFLLYFFIGLFIIVYGLGLVFKKNVGIRRTALDIPLVLFSVFVLCIPFFSLSTSASFLGRMDVFLPHALFLLGCSLWVWFFLQFVDTERSWHVMQYGILASGVVAQIHFLVGRFVEGFSVGNVIAAHFSLFALYVAAIFVFSCGLFAGAKQKLLQALFGATLLLSFVTLMVLGFKLVWWMVLVGLALLLIYTFVSIERTPRIVVAVFSVLTIIAILLIIFGTPRAFKATLPTELSLGASGSWQVAQTVQQLGFSEIVFGTGLATFTEAFTAARSPLYNVQQVSSDLYFNRSFSTILHTIVEMGWLGLLLLLGFVAMVLGTAPAVWKYSKNKKSNTTLLWQMLGLYAAFLVLSVGMWFFYFEFSLWMLWWFFLAVYMLGFASMSGEKKYAEKIIKNTMFVAHRAWFSFVLFAVVACVVLAEVFLARFYIAEYWHVQAESSSDIQKKYEHVQKATSLRNSYAPYHMTLAEINLARAGQAQGETTEVAAYLGDAIVSAKKATELEPNNARAWEILGTVYLNASSVVDNADTWAVSSLERATELSPSNAELQWLLANAYQLSQDVEKAEDVFLHAVDLQPNFVEAYRSLSILYQSLDRLDDAIALYEPIFDQIQTNPQMLFYLGTLFYNRNQDGDTERARAVYTRAIELLPDYADALYALGLLHERDGDIDSALNYYKKVQTYNPSNQDVAAKINSLTK